MDDAVLPLRARLPAMAEEEAAARNRLLAGLDGLEVGAERLAAEVAGPAAAPAVALAFAAGDVAVHLAAETIDGQPTAPLSVASPALPEALVALSRLEPLIAALERVLGQALEPIALQAEPAAGLRLRLTLADVQGEVLHAVRLTAPAALAARALVRRDRALGPAERAPVACRLSLSGPHAPRGELGRLEAGDVVVLPSAGGEGLAAELAAGNGRWRGRFKIVEGEFLADQQEGAVLDETLVAASPGPDGPGAIPAGVGGAPSPAAQASVSTLPVRLQVVLPSLSLPVGALAALAPGSVATLAVQGEDLPVALQAEGVEIATGRLVALGSGYGVLIDRVTGR